MDKNKGKWKNPRGGPSNIQSLKLDQLDPLRQIGLFNGCAWRISWDSLAVKMEHKDIQSSNSLLTMY